MFWRSILEGLMVFRYWQIWLCSCIFLILLYTSRVLLFGILFKNDDDEFFDRGNARYYISLFISILIEAILLSILIALISPILLGDDNLLAFQIFIDIIGQIILAGVIVSVVVFVMSFIPLLYFESLGSQYVTEAFIIFWILYGKYIKYYLDSANITDKIFPSYFETFLIIIFGLIIAKVVSLLSFLVSALTSEVKYVGILSIIFVSVGWIIKLIGGIIPLFIFISYIKLAIEKLG